MELYMLQLLIGSNRVPILFRIDNCIDNSLAKDYRASLCGFCLGLLAFAVFGASVNPVVVL